MNDTSKDWVIECNSEAATQQLAETFALALKAGDLVALYGDLGAGKTTFARALIRTATGDPFTEVPSPTFTLVQLYEDLPFGSLAHLDLYRLSDGEELEALGLDDALATGAALVEWPQNAGAYLPKPTITLNLEQGNADDKRTIIINGTVAALERLKRSARIREFLDAHGHTESHRTHFFGDASSRAYEKIQSPSGKTLILMNAPSTPDGPIIKGGKPYSQIAHLAEDVRAFVGVANALRNAGMRAPEIFAHDMNQGLLLIEDFGNGSMLDANRVPVREKYEASMEALAALHEKHWQATYPLPGGKTHDIPPFDRGALLIEVDLLPQWYAPYVLGHQLNEDQKASFETVWNDLIDRLETAEISLVLRDFHSPNLIWMNDAEGTDRIGIIDFQDAMIGPSAYDVASIAQDARVDVSAELEQDLVAHYCNTRTTLDQATFEEAYAIMAAERATKVLGIFVRLSKRDGKHAYLAHLPRIQNYLARSLTHPVLAPYREWVETVLGEAALSGNGQKT